MGTGMAEQSEQDILDRLLSDPEVQAAAEDSPPTASPPDLQGLGLSLSPDLLGKLPAMLSMLSPAPSGEKDGKRDDRTALLIALKPYMSEQRCRAIDALITFGRISTLLGNFR